MITRKKTVTIVHVALLIVLGIVAWASSASLKPENWIWAISLLFTIFTGWLLWSWAVVSGDWLNFYGIFLVLAAMFNGGQVYLEVFHLNPEGLLGMTVPRPLLLQTVLFVALGLGSLHLGALLAPTVASNPQGRPVPLASGDPKLDRAARLAGLVLLAISSGPTAVVLGSTLRTAVSDGYFALYQRAVATGAEGWRTVLSALFVPAAVFLGAGSRKSPALLVVSALAVAVYSGALLVAGFRLDALSAVAAYVWVLDNAIGHLKRRLILPIGLALILVVVPVVGATRGLVGAERYSTETLRSSLSARSPITATVQEIGGSMSAVAYTISLVPSLRGYDLGASYAYAALGVVPNLFWAIHPSIQHGTAASWLAWTVSPTMAAAGGGLGYSFLAEAYLNFGWIAGLLSLVVIGALVQTFADKGKLQNAPAVALRGAFLFFFLRFARGESAPLLRALVWYSYVPYLLALMLAWLRTEHRWLTPVTKG